MKASCIIFFVSWFSIMTGNLLCQENNTIQQKLKTSRFINNAENLTQALKSENDSEIAAAYFAIAEDYENAKNFPESESYYIKSKQYFEKINDKNSLADVTRRIARVQEKQIKKDDAILNYKTAASYSKSNLNSEGTRLNLKDAARVAASSHQLQKEEEIINTKLNDIKLSTKNQSELPETYVQLADVQAKQQNLDTAILNYQNALVNTSDPDKLIDINQKLMQTFITQNNFKKAIDAGNELVKKSEINNNPLKKVEIINQLSSLHLKNNDQSGAIKLLHESYEIAKNSGQTIEARNIVENLSKIYTVSKNEEKIRLLQADFIANLEKMIRNDSTLMDHEIIALTEQKIRNLEIEKTLKDKLISRQQIISIFLASGVIMLALFSFYIYSSLRTIKRNNKLIALQSLRKDMNPHFIFNSLNSINQFISQNDERAANKYLFSFSGLMRNVLENSSSDFITLDKEMDMITKYLELEHHRFDDKFEFSIKTENIMDSEHTLIPNMIIQPHLENAIWHGLRYKNTPGHLFIVISEKENQIIVNINDDGIGRYASQKSKTSHQKDYKSKGTNNVSERIRLLNDLYHLNISFETIDMDDPTGTMVNIIFPSDIVSKIKA